MLKIQVNCPVCKLVKEDRKLLGRIYESKFFIKSAGETLKDIQKDYADDFSYHSLTNHCNKHQFMSDADFSSRHLKQIAKKAEQQVLRRNIEASTVWDTVIQEGMEKLEAGELTMKTADLLKAAKDKSDHSLKVKDQELAMAEMIYHFASGENKESRSYDRKFVEGEAVEDYDPAAGITGTDNRRTDGPGPIYHTITWDALTQGSGKVPARDESEKN